MKGIVSGQWLIYANFWLLTSCTMGFASALFNVKAHRLSMVHMKDLDCDGHAGNIVYSKHKECMRAIRLAQEMERFGKRYENARFLMRKSRFFELYADVTCAHIAGVDHDLSFRLQAIETMLRIYGGMSVAGQSDSVCAITFTCLARIIEDLSKIGEDRTTCLLACVYAHKASSRPEYADAALSMVRTVLAKKSDAHCRDIVLAHPILPVLSLAHAVQDQKLMRWYNFYLYERGPVFKRHQMLKFIQEQAMAGDRVAVCYELALALNKRSRGILEECLARLNLLVDHESDRQLLPMLINACYPATLQWLQEEAAGHNKYASAIVGIIAYVQGEYEQAFKALRYAADMELSSYFYFCFAELYKNDRIHQRNNGIAIKMYERAVLAGPDKELQDALDESITSIARQGYVPALGQLFLLRMQDKSSYKQIVYSLDQYTCDTNPLKADFVAYMKHPRRLHRIVNMSLTGFAIAPVVLSRLMSSAI